MPVGADAEDLQVDAAGIGDRALVVVAGVLDAVERPVGHADARRVEAERLDDLARDHRAVALGVGGVEADVLVEREAAHARDVDACEPRTAAPRTPAAGSTRREAEHGLGVRADEPRDLVGDERAGRPRHRGR